MKIPVLHLEEGIHEFQQILKSGVMDFNDVSVYPNDLNLKVILNKFGKNISCTIDIDTIGHFTCDRCLTEFDRNVTEQISILFHTGTDDELETDEEDVVNISQDTLEIDLLPYIREDLLIAIPMKKLCKENCKGLCPNCGVDLNLEDCNCVIEHTDPRWDKLKTLKVKS